jgi:hypothetical protein
VMTISTHQSFHPEGSLKVRDARARSLHGPMDSMGLHVAESYERVTETQNFGKIEIGASGLGESWG